MQSQNSARIVRLPLTILGRHVAQSTSRQLVLPGIEAFELEMSVRAGDEGNRVRPVVHTPEAQPGLTQGFAAGKLHYHSRDFALILFWRGRGFRSLRQCRASWKKQCKGHQNKLHQGSPLGEYT